MSAEERENWCKQLEEKMANRICPECGSNKVTTYLRGRPYMAYVEWAEEQSQERGWKILVLGGCTTEGMDTCSQCGSNVPREY
jgi:ssDNA-binding Zn-finger/Zn-ribbon topoisomerase 1